MKLSKANKAKVAHASFDFETTLGEILNAILDLFFDQPDAKEQLADCELAPRKSRGRTVKEADESEDSE